MLIYLEFATLAIPVIVADALGKYLLLYLDLLYRFIDKDHGFMGVIDLTIIGYKSSANPINYIERTNNLI